MVLNNNSDKACALGAIYRCGTPRLPGSADYFGDTAGAEGAADSKSITPNKAHADVYADLIKKYDVVEASLLSRFARIQTQEN